MSEPVVETKAQRAERLKGALNPWVAYAEIERFAREGVGAIPPEWLGTYFRWWGIYTQGDGVGAVGGKGGEGRAAPYFMLRIRIPNGFLTAAQLRAVADLAERYARGRRRPHGAPEHPAPLGARSRTCPRSSRPSARARSRASAPAAT